MSAGHSGGLFGDVLRGEGAEEFKGDPPPAAVKPSAALAVAVVNDGREVDAAHGWVGFGEGSLGVGDKDVFGLVDKRAHDLGDSGVELMGGLISPLKQRHLFCGLY